MDKQDLFLCPFPKMKSMGVFLTVSLAVFSFYSNPIKSELPFVAGVKSSLFLLRDVKHLSQL